jgi:RNA polymerase primary sigma factor
MTGTAHSEQEFLPGLEPSENGHKPVSAGTYSLRRIRYFNDAEQVSSSNDEPRQALANLSEKDDFDAEQRTLIQHLHMVISIARQYTDRGVEDVELVKAGNHGLIQALEHFKPGKDTDFSNYAAMCIRQHIEHLIADRHELLKVAQTEPQYADSRHRTTPSVSAQPQGIYVIRAFIENRIHEHRHSSHPELPPEFGGLYD